MSLVKTVCKAMERIAPLRLAESWDNVGLLVESPIQRHTSNRILLTIDLTPPVLSESLSLGTSVIIAYHPPLFRPLSSLTLANPLQKTLLKCAAEGVSVYSPHTALDSVWGGVNDWLAEGIMGKVEGVIGALKAEKIGILGEQEGAEGRLLTFHDPIAMSELVKNIKTHLGLAQVQVAYATKETNTPVKSIGICAGSGGGVLGGTEADVYLTGEMGHHELLAAVATGKSVILCGHTNTERGYLPILASKLRAELAKPTWSKEELEVVKGAEVVVSKADECPMIFV